MLKVNLLGPPQIIWEDTTLEIPRRQVRALLYRLSVREQVISRDELCFLFWPNTPDAIARRHLSHLLSHLRIALPDKNIISAVKNNIHLNATHFLSDADTFEKLHAIGTIEALQQAVDLYNGHFLSGFSLPDCSTFERWVSDEGYHFENLYLESLSSLIKNAKSSGKHADAIRLAKMYLAVDDLDEAVHRELIEIYNTTGKRDAALAQYEECVVVLERELGVQPLPETRALYESILERNARVISHQNINKSLIKLPDLKVPLVGRQTECQQLEQIWHNIKNGGVQVVFISGEAGIGKTRLLEAFINLHSQEALILTSSCQSISKTIPYHTLVDALSPLVSKKWQWTPNSENALSSSSTELLSDLWLAEAARVLPDLRGFYPNLPQPLSLKSDEARGRLFEALSRMFLSLAYNSLPLIMAFDNLHWADNATLEWLEFWGHFIQSHEHLDHEMPRILMLIAYRTDEEQTLIKLQHSLVKTIGFVELRLSELNDNAIRELVKNLISTISHNKDINQSSLTNWLQKVSGNNPLYLIETLHALSEKGLLGSDTNQLSSIPILNSLKMVIEERIQNLSTQARQVLGASAILIDDFDFNMIQGTSGRNELETVAALEELIARQFLIERISKFRFRHELIKQSAADTQGPVRSQLLHRRAAKVIEKIRPAAVTSLAFHYQMGNEPEKALQFHGVAAKQAEEIFAWQEAEEHQRHMLVLLNQIDPNCTDKSCKEQRSQILVSRAHLHYLQGKISERDADLATLEKLAGSNHDKLSLLSIMEKVRYLNLDSKFKTAIKEAQQGLILSTELKDQRATIRLLSQIGFSHYFLGQPKSALKALESAMEMPNEVLEPMMWGRISHILGYVYFHLGQLSQSMTHQQEAYNCHQSIGDNNRIAWDGLDIGLLLLKAGDFSEARKKIEKHLDFARRIGAQPPEAYGLTLLGNWHLYSGDYAKAIEYYQQAYNLQQKLRSVKGCIDAKGGLALSFYHMGNVNEAQLLLGNAVTQASSITHPRLLVQALISLALVDISSGQITEAVQELQKAVKTARTSQFFEGLASGLAALARAQRLSGENDKALISAQEALEIALSKDLPTNALWGRLEIGATQLTLGDAQTARNQLEQAKLIIPRAHQGWIGIEQVYEIHARILRTLGCDQDADQQQHKIDTCIFQKAKHIPDPKTQQEYISFTKNLLSTRI